jgi:hypothetical protein
MKRNKSNCLYRVLTILAFSGAAFFGQSASAQSALGDGIYAFTSRSTYEADTDSIVDAITFNNLTTKNGVAAFPTGFTSGGVDFTSPAGTTLSAIGPNYNGTVFTFPDSTSPPSVTIYAYASTDATIKATLLDEASSGPLTAVGTDIATSISTGSITADLFLAGNNTITPDATYTYASPDGEVGLGFLGFLTTGSTDIAYVKFIDNTVDYTDTSNLTLDNFTYGIVDPDFIPEPSSYALLGVGALALVIFRRRLLAL